MERDHDDAFNQDYGYVVLNSGGIDLYWRETEQDAIEMAVERLEDDPELGQLEVARIEGSWLDHVADIVQGPGRNFEGEVVVLRKGEKLANPFGNQSSMTETEIRDVYADDAGKREAMLRDLR